MNVHPYKAGKNVLDLKCYCRLNVDQETLDQHKSSDLVDKNYDIALGNLQGPPAEPPLLKKFNKSSFSYNHFFEILLTCRNACYEGISIESFFQSAITSWHIDINREFLLAALFL